MAIAMKLTRLGFIIAWCLRVVCGSADQQRVELRVDFHDYQHPTDKTQNGRKCDFTLFPLKDYCDPEFTIDIDAVWAVNGAPSRTEKIAHHRTPVYTNEKHIRFIYHTKKLISGIPNELQFRVTVEDFDKAGSSTLIERILYNFKPNSTTRQVLRLGNVVKLTLDFRLDCLPNYYGQSCETFCETEPNMWNCEHGTGKRLCLLDCGHGLCEETETGGPNCVCDYGWGGKRCSELLFDDRNTTVPNMEPSWAKHIGSGVAIGLAICGLLICVAVLLFIIYRRKKRSETKSMGVVHMAANNPLYLSSINSPRQSVADHSTLPMSTKVATYPEGWVSYRRDSDFPQPTRDLPMAPMMTRPPPITFSSIVDGASPVSSVYEEMDGDEGSPNSDEDIDVYQVPRELNDERDLFPANLPPSIPNSDGN